MLCYCYVYCVAVLLLAFICVSLFVIMSRIISLRLRCSYYLSTVCYVCDCLMRVVIVSVCCVRYHYHHDVYIALYYWACSYKVLSCYSLCFLLVSSVCHVFVSVSVCLLRFPLVRVRLRLLPVLLLCLYVIISIINDV